MKNLFLLIIVYSSALFSIEKPLQNFKVAILVDQGFEQDEMVKPREALDKAGAKTYLISPHNLFVQGWKLNRWGNRFKIDLNLKKAKAKDFDALLLPGGVMSPDKLRTNTQAVYFVKDFVDSKKPIAVICHGPWTLINANAVSGKKITSWPSLKVDLLNAGANWVDEKVVREGNLVSSRKPEDIPYFNSEMVKLFSESKNKKNK